MGNLFFKLFMFKNFSLHRSINSGVASKSLDYNKNATKTTIDQAEVDKHSKIAQEWWDLNGPMKALHSYNLLRVPFIRDGLVPSAPNERTISPLANKTILDVGCGGGILSEAIARLGAKVTGIDASKELIDIATEHSKLDLKLEQNRPSYHHTTIEEHSNEFADHYDAVVASEVIEHVADKELFLQSCVRAVKPGGKIFITTPNRSRLFQVFGIWMAEYVLKFVPKGTHEYEKITTPNEVTFLLERNNCHVQLIHGILYFPIIDKWAWVNTSTFVFGLQAEKLKDIKEI